VGVNWALKAQDLLLEDWGITSDVWSVTSWNELRRDGLEVDRFNLLHPEETQRVAFVTSQLDGRKGPVIAASDWMRAVQDQIREWVPGDFISLGTDGWGMSDTRGALRRHFLVDAESITVQTLSMLAKRGEVDAALVQAAIDKYNLTDPAAADQQQQHPQRPRLPGPMAPQPPARQGHAQQGQGRAEQHQPA
jgi:pyruvate dehydrogenase E1 component